MTTPNTLEWAQAEVARLSMQVSRLRMLVNRLIPDREAHGRCDPGECGYRQALNELAEMDD